MGQYQYKARDNQGQIATGVLQAPSPAEAAGMLRAEGKFVVSLQAAVAGMAQSEDRSSDLPSKRTRVPRKEVISFTHQLAVMIDTGVPISEALHCIHQQTEHPKFRAVLEHVTDHVQAGGELSVALHRYPKTFPTIMTSLVQASEMSGTMGPMLERISTYLAKEYQTMRKVRGAMVYPLVMLVMVVLVTTFLLTFVLPRFTKVYQAKGAALPAPTQILIELSNLLIHDWYFWILGLALLVVGGWKFIQTRSGTRCVDYLKLKTPIIGSLMSKIFLARTCRTMGTMLAAGVPMLDMIANIRMITRNVYYEQLWDDVDHRLKRGTQLSQALLESPLIPRSVGQMILAGEKGGRLCRVMDKIAHYTDEELDDQIRTTTQLIEPAMIIIMGSIVGFVAISLLLPIFEMSRVVTAK